MNELREKTERIDKIVEMLKREMYDTDKKTDNEFMLNNELSATLKELTKRIENIEINQEKLRDYYANEKPSKVFVCVDGGDIKRYYIHRMTEGLRKEKYISEWFGGRPKTTFEKNECEYFTKREAIMIRNYLNKGHEKRCFLWNIGRVG